MVTNTVTSTSSLLVQRIAPGNPRSRGSRPASVRPAQPLSNDHRWVSDSFAVDEFARAAQWRGAGERRTTLGPHPDR